MHYKYCPECGTKTVDKPAGDEGEVPFCEQCQEYLFDTFPSCVIVLTYNEFDEVVLCRQEYMSDTYRSFTSGYITPGETAEETAFREVKEEIGVELQSLEYAGTYWFDRKGMLMHGFIGYAPKCDFVLSEEVDAAEWVPYKEAPKTMWPDRPSNAAFGIYKEFLKKKAGE